jgi:hypothetical protein
VDYVSHCLTNGILLYSKGMQLQLSFDMLGRFLKNCAGIEKYQFCLWSGKVASKAKEAEVPEKAKKSILWKVQVYMMKYIFILNPKIVKPHTISTHISSHISKHPSQPRFQEPVWRPVAPYRTKAKAKARPGHTRRQGDETIFPGSQFVCHQNLRWGCS